MLMKSTVSTLECGNILNCEICPCTGKLQGIFIRQNQQQILDNSNASQFSFRTGGSTEYPSEKLTTWRVPEELLKNYKKNIDDEFQLKSIIKNKNSWEISSTSSKWSLKQFIRNEFQGEGISIEFELTYKGKKEVLLRDAQLTMLNVSMASETESILELPGKNAVPHLKLAEIPDGALNVYTGSSPVERSPLTGLHNSSDKRSLLIWADSKDFHCYQQINKNGNTLSLHHRIQAASRMRTGDTITIGKQYIRLYEGTWLKALREFQNWYKFADHITPIKRCSWTREATIYEVFTGKVSFSNGVNYSPYPEMSKLIEDLERINRLGFNTIQLMPRQPFTGYTVFDWHDTYSAYGGTEDLKRLVCRAHQLNMKVILDVIMHGTVDAEGGQKGLKHFSIRNEFFKFWRDRLPTVNPYRQQHTNWFSRTDSGNNAFMLTWLFDRTNLDWQHFFVNVLKYYISEYNIDGFRFDAPTFANQPNWAQNLPYPAGTSCLGAYKLLKNAQNEIRHIKPDILWHIETCGPLFSAFADLVYDYETHWLRTSLLETHTGTAERSFEFGNRKINAAQLADWLEQHRLSLPPSHLVKNVFEGHGDWWYGEQGIFQRDLFGIDAARALFAFCVFSEGAIMNFVGGEYGMESFCSQILKIRNERSIFQTSCKYSAPESDNDMVLSIARKEAIVLINFGSEKTKCNISLLEPEACELISGKSINTTEKILLSPYETKIISFC